MRKCRSFLALSLVAVCLFTCFSFAAAPTYAEKNAKDISLYQWLFGDYDPNATYPSVMGPRIGGEITIDMGTDPAFYVQVFCSGDSRDAGDAWCLLAAGPFICEWQSESLFKINATEPGEAELEIQWLKGDTDEVIASRTVLVRVVGPSGETLAEPVGDTTEEAWSLAEEDAGVAEAAAKPLSVQVSQENITIDRAAGGTADVQISMEGDLYTAAYWSLAAAGPFTCEWTGEGQFRISAYDTGEADLDVLLCEDGTDAVLASKTIHVKVIDTAPVEEAPTPVEEIAAAAETAAAWAEEVGTPSEDDGPEAEAENAGNLMEAMAGNVAESLLQETKPLTILVSQENITLDNSIDGEGTAVVTVSYEGDLNTAAYWSLAASGPFTCAWTGPAEFTITALDAGEADLDVLMCEEGTDAVLASKTIHVTVIEPLVEVITAAPATAAPVTVAPATAAPATAAPATAAPTAQNSAKRGKNPNHKKAVRQTWKVNTVECTDKDGKKHTGYILGTGLCNVSAYATLVNRFVWEKYGDSSQPCTTDVAMRDVMKIKYREKFIISRQNKECVLVEEVTVNTPYLVNGVKTYPKEAEGSTKKKKIYTDKTLSLLKRYAENKFGTAKRFQIGYVYTKNDFEGSTNDRNTMRFTKNKKYWYSYKGHKIKASSLKAKNYRKPEQLAKLLDAHPEGVYVHAARYNSKGEATAMHAAVVVGYTVKNGVYSFDVVDPATTTTFYTNTITNKNKKLINISSLKITELDQVIVLFAE